MVRRCGGSSTEKDTKEQVVNNSPCVGGLPVVKALPSVKGKGSSVLLVCQKCSINRLDGGWDSGFGLDLPVEGLGLGLQAPKLPLDEVCQGLPHFQLKAAFKEVKY